MKGRNTIRKGGTVTGANGQASRPIKRWRFDPEPNTTLARLETAYMAGIDSMDRVEDRAQRNKTGGKLTREGSRDDVLHYALNELIPELHKARMTIKRAKAEVLERRAKLKIAEPDKSDVAAAFRRMEMRGLLRDMTEQPQYFAKAGDKLPREVIEAILEMPPEFSGVPKLRHDRLKQQVLAAHHGREIAEIEEIEEAIAAAESCVETSRDELRLEVGGIDQKQWDELAAPIETRHAAPWLRRRGTEVHLVDLEQRIERKPTEEELATGIFANNHDEYVRRQLSQPSQQL